MNNGVLYWKELKIITVDNYYGCDFGAVIFKISFHTSTECVYKFNEYDLSDLIRGAIIKKIEKLKWPKLAPRNEYSMEYSFETSLTKNFYRCVFVCETSKNNYEFYKNIANENL